MNPSDFILVQAHQLSGERGGQVLFRNIDFSLASGEILQIVGPNGVGKSSLLRILSGLLIPKSGQLSVCEERFYLGHQLGLKMAFTPEENLRFDLRYQKPTSQAIHSLLNEMGLLNQIAIQTHALSQGQQQRLALAKCLLSTGKLWILDEPFAALDANSRAMWMQKIREHAQQGGAVVISSHLPLSIPNMPVQQLELFPC